MEDKPLPETLGFGFYISDSEDSVDSAVADWIQKGCPEEYPLPDSQEDSSTAYQSALEPSAKDGTESEPEWFFLEDNDRWKKGPIFPNPPAATHHLEKSLEFKKKDMMDLLKTNASFDRKLQDLEMRRQKNIWTIEQEFIATLVALKLEQHNESIDEEKNDQKSAEESTSTPTHLVPDHSQFARPSEVEVSTSSPSPVNEPDILQADPQVQVTEKLEVPKQQERKSSEKTLYPAPDLLVMSEQMKIPQTVPPPQNLFYVDITISESKPEEAQLAFHASKNAMQFEEYHKKIAQQLIESMGDYAINIGNRSICKGIDKCMKLVVQQIAADEQQVQIKTQAVLRTLSTLEGSAGVIYAYAQFSRYLINKCGGISDALVFAVAKVTAGVIERHPKLLSILLSFLHEVSLLTVPKYYTTTNFSLHGTLMEKLGFRDITKREEDRKETADEFIDRQIGYVKFYGALIELDGSVHGLRFGWSYLSRMLNNLPPDRTTASALMAFLKVSGYSLFKKYKRQFFKVLLYIHSIFLVSLANGADKEAQAVYIRLQSYLQDHVFTRPPQSKILKSASESQTLRT